MDECFRCQKNEEEAVLLDAIHDAEIVKICESCAKIENLPIIRKPSDSQLKSAERPYSVYERMAKAAGLNDKAKDAARKQEEKETRKIVSGISLDNLRKPRDFSKPSPSPPFSPSSPYSPSSPHSPSPLSPKSPIAPSNPMPKNNNLAENFHWQIMMARRNKAISQRKLAEVIGESETSIKMIEQGELPQNSDKLISKIEQYLRINLRKNTNQQNSQIGIAQNQKIEEQNPPARIIKYDEKALKNITISDLVKMKKEKQEQALAEKPGQKDSIEVINLDDEL